MLISNQQQKLFWCTLSGQNLLSAVSFFRGRELLRSYANSLPNLPLDFNLSKSIHIPIFSRPHLFKSKNTLHSLGRQLFFGSVTKTTYTGLRVLSLLLEPNKVWTELLVIYQTILNCARKQLWRVIWVACDLEGHGPNRFLQVLSESFLYLREGSCFKDGSSLNFVFLWNDCIIFIHILWTSIL